MVIGFLVVSSDVSFFFSVFFLMMMLSLAKENLKLIREFFSEVDSDVSIPIQFLYNLYIKDCYRTSNPLKSLVCCLSRFF